MSGLDKIKDRIIGEAEEEAREKIEKAEEEAKEIKSEAVREADGIRKAIMDSSEREIKSYEERVASSIDMEKRTRILEAKQEMIQEVISEAKKKLESLSDKEYYELTIELIKKNLREGEGTVYFSESDKARFPEGFSDEIRKIAKNEGADIQVAWEDRDISPGFILSYGGIEENCTFEKMIEAKKDDLSDLVQTILFS